MNDAENAFMRDLLNEIIRSSRPDLELDPAQSTLDQTNDRIGFKLHPRTAAGVPTLRLNVSLAAFEEGPNHKVRLRPNIKEVIVDHINSWDGTRSTVVNVV